MELCNWIVSTVFSFTLFAWFFCLGNGNQSDQHDHDWYLVDRSANVDHDRIAGVYLTDNLKDVYFNKKQSDQQSDHRSDHQSKAAIDHRTLIADEINHMFYDRWLNCLHWSWWYNRPHRSNQRSPFPSSVIYKSSRITLCAEHFRILLSIVHSWSYRRTEWIKITWSKTLIP